MSRFVPNTPLVRIVLASVAALLAATLVLTVVVLVVPAWSSRALHGYLLVVAAVAVAAAARAMLGRFPVLWRSSSGFGKSTPSPPEELPERARVLYRLVSRSGWDAAGFELELRPVLQAIATQRLATFHGVNLNREPERARLLLGEPLWTVLTPIDLKHARTAPGVDLTTLAAAIAALEKLDAAPHP